MTLIHMKSRKSGEHDVCVIQSDDYLNPSVSELIVLKEKDHIPSFKTVMKSFEIEMVKIYFL